MTTLNLTESSKIKGAFAAHTVPHSMYLYSQSWDIDYTVQMGTISLSSKIVGEGVSGQTFVIFNNYLSRSRVPKGPLALAGEPRYWNWVYVRTS